MSCMLPRRGLCALARPGRPMTTGRPTTLPSLGVRSLVQGVQGGRTLRGRAPGHRAKFPLAPLGGAPAGSARVVAEGDALWEPRRLTEEWRAKMIQAILVFNNHGKPRLVRFYQRFVSAAQPRTSLQGARAPRSLLPLRLPGTASWPPGLLRLAWPPDPLTSFPDRSPLPPCSRTRFWAPWGPSCGSRAPWGTAGWALVVLGVAEGRFPRTKKHAASYSLALAGGSGEGLSWNYFASVWPGAARGRPPALCRVKVSLKVQVMRKDKCCRVRPETSESECEFSKNALLGKRKHHYLPPALLLPQRVLSLWLGVTMSHP